MNRNPNIGSTIWQLAATTTPATARPPSTFSTRSLEMAGGHRGLPTGARTSGSPGGDVVLLTRENYTLIVKQKAITEKLN